jgi:hypothetical protein
VAYLEIEAETESEAIAKAVEQASLRDVEDWEVLELEADAELIDEGDKDTPETKASV